MTENDRARRGIDPGDAPACSRLSEESFSGAVHIESVRPTITEKPERGTGLFLDAQGHIAVPADVVYGANDVTVEIDVPKVGHKTFKADIIKADVDNDIAILQLRDFQAGSIPTPKFTNSGTIAEGANITSFGYPSEFPTLRMGDNLVNGSQGLKRVHGKVTGIEKNADMLSGYVKILERNVASGRGAEERDSSGATNDSELAWAKNAYNRLKNTNDISYYAEYDQQMGMGGAPVYSKDGIFGMSVRGYGFFDPNAEVDPYNTNIVSIVPIETIKRLIASSDPQYRYNAKEARDKHATNNLTFQHVPSITPATFKKLSE